MARFGSEYRWYANTSTHDEDGFQATGDHAVSKGLIERLTGKIEDNKDELVEVKTEFLDDAEVVVLAFGCTARPARGAVLKARGEGIKAGLLVPLTLWPVADAVIAQIADTAKTIVVPEMNLGQYVHPVREIASRRKAEVISLPKVGGEPFVSDDILNGIKGALCHA
jgi:2-oxoglutarate ferredoxin oxidoreductase subunit alpha